MTDKYQFQCIICKKTILSDETNIYKLDPCSLVLVSNIDRKIDHQKEQTFFCHFECFRQIINNDDILYIMDPGFSTPAEVKAEEKSIGEQIDTILNLLEREQQRNYCLDRLFAKSKGVWYKTTDFVLSEVLTTQIEKLEEFMGESLLIMWGEDFYADERRRNNGGRFIMVSADMEYDFVGSRVILGES